MVPSFNTSGQFLGYKEKKQTPVRSYRGPDTTQDKGLSRGGRATHGYGKAYLKGGRVK